MEKYKDKVWLKEQYIEKDKLQYEIAGECRVDRGTISYWINKYGIEKEKKKYEDKKWLKEQYIEKDKSQRKIASEYGTSRATIRYWINKFGIETKSNEELAKEKEKLARENPLQWSENIAYLVGLITADGCLRKDRPNIIFTSKDYSLILQAKEIAENNLDTNNRTLYQNSQNDVWNYEITSRKFYYFLKDMGLMPNKSLKIRGLDIPDNMFSNWLRGEIDGDGCFCMTSRYDNLCLKIYSGSSTFLEWLSQKLKDYNLIKGKGNVYEGNCYQLRFGDRDSKQIARKIYGDASYYLQRKYDVVGGFVDFLNEGSQKYVDFSSQKKSVKGKK